MERMIRRVVMVLTLCCSVDTASVSCMIAAEPQSGAAVAETPNWPQFRGPNAQGISADTNLPATLDPAGNVVWKTPILPGVSSPCVWGDAVFLTAFTDSKRLAVLCIAAADGRIRWQREVPAERIENVHPRLGSPAQATPATDGQRVYVFFGSVGLVCLDFQGELRWRHALGPFSYHLGWGAGSSPILYGDSVILNCDHDGESHFFSPVRLSYGIHSIVGLGCRCWFAGHATAGCGSGRGRFAAAHSRGGVEG